MQHLLPVRRALEATQVWLELPGEDLQRCRLTDTVRADKPEHL